MNRRLFNYFFLVSTPEEGSLYFSEFSFSFFIQLQSPIFQLYNSDFSLFFSLDFLDSVQDLNPIQVYYLIYLSSGSVVSFLPVLSMADKICSVFFVYFIYRFKFILFSLLSVRLTSSVSQI